MTIVQALKTLDTSAVQLDEMIMLSEHGQVLRTGYERTGLDAPEWLTGALDLLDAAIKAAARDTLMLRLKEAEQEEAGFKTREEKRAEAAARAKALRTKLGLAPAESVSTT